jgi:enediyne biosynthesis protein E3
MPAYSGTLFKFAFGISPGEASFAKRGFRVDSDARSHLECIGMNFLIGYNQALEDRRHDVLTAALNEVAAEFRGFAYEGAAMALALLDQLIPWKRMRLESFMSGPGAPHIFMLHVGAGWSLARLRRRYDVVLATPYPLLRWLAIDGYGFHEGYFHWRNYVVEQRSPKRMKGYARRVFDQGLGRSLWFIEGADVERIAATIEGFPALRRADLWSGVGLACAYAGGASQAAIEELGRLARCFNSHLAQGVAFAAKTRERAKNLTRNTEVVCRTLCGLSATEAAGITDSTLSNLPETEAVPAYEIWRQRIQNTFLEGVHSDQLSPC